MADDQKVHIIGIGDDGLEGLTKAARELVRNAQLVVGSPRMLSSIPTGNAQRLEVSSDLEPLVRAIDSNRDVPTVILTTGDPLFFGVARFLCERLGKERFEVVPHVSTMQMAFARVKESWDEAYLANLASVELNRVVEKTRSAEKAGLFTTEEIPPSAVAREMLDRGIDYFTAYICENLGSPDERVTQSELSELAAQDFSPLNILILIRKPDVPDRARDVSQGRLFGNPDELYLQSRPKRGLLTPAEVRVIALSLMDLRSSSVVWDVGAGSGSVSIEAAKIADQGTVYAIEMDTEDHELVKQNAARFAVDNVVAKLGKAPEAWVELPDADAVFISGTGRSVGEITRLAYDRIRKGGKIVVNVSSISNLAAVQEVLSGLATDVEVRMVSIAEAMDQLEAIGFEARNPTFLISAEKN